ncbi:MAG: hypothetical protein IPG23_25380 [Burkholderiales bacterium]|nr:hypothetical protein [Burkholderiales bacterium]
MSSSAVSLLLLVAMGQGLFLSASLWFSSQHELRVANRLLSTLVLLFALFIGHAWLGVNGLFGSYPHLATSVATLPLLWARCCGCICKICCRGAATRRSVAHGLPFLLALLAWAPYYLQSADVKLALMVPRTQLPWYLGVFGAIKAIHVCAYVLLSYRLIVRTDRQTPDQALVRSLRRLTLLLGWGLGINAAVFAAEIFELRFPVSSDTWGAAVLTSFVYGLAFTPCVCP